MTTTKTSVSVPLVQAIENAWHAIQENHPEVPDVVVTLGSGAVARGMKWGHFAASVWAKGDEQVHELFVGGEGLMRGPQALMGTLLHEAIHAACENLGIKETSRNGRYHNRKFAEMAEKFGIEVEHSAELGFSTTTMPDHTAAQYETALLDLDASITAYRSGYEMLLLPGLPGATPTAGGTVKAPKPGGRKSNNNGVSASCGCGRKIRLSVSAYEAGAITCNVCGEDFTA